jgi:hypothetical protein
MPASSSSRPMSTTSFSEGPSGVTPATGTNPSDDHGRKRNQQPETFPGAQLTHNAEGNRGSLSLTNEAAVQSSVPSSLPPPSSRSRWTTSRAPQHLSSTKGPMSVFPAQPRGPPAVEPLKDQPSEAWNFRRSRPGPLPQSSNKIPSFPKKLPPASAVSSSSSDRSTSADSWKMASDAQGKTSDQLRSADTAPSPPLDLTKGTYSVASQYPGPTARPQRIGSELSSSSSSVAPPATSTPSSAVGSSSPPTSVRPHSPWRRTGIYHSAGLFPAVALAVAPPAVASNAQPPAFSPPPPSSSSLSDSHSVKSFETASSTTSASRPKRRGKRSKHHKDGKASEAPASSPDLPGSS